MSDSNRRNRLHITGIMRTGSGSLSDLGSRFERATVHLVPDPLGDESLMRALLLTTLAAMTGAAPAMPPGTITSVTIRDADFAQVKALGPDELDAFARMWASKRRVDRAQAGGGTHYKLDRRGRAVAALPLLHLGPAHAVGQGCPAGVPGRRSGGIQPAHRCGRLRPEKSRPERGQVHFHRPGPGLGAPSSRLRRPSSGLDTPGSELHRPSRELRPPSSGLHHPSPGLGAPSSGLGRPGSELDPPSPELHRPSFLLGA